MSALRAWFWRFGGLFGRERRDRELAEEMESHLQMHIEDNLHAGMSPEEARRQALIKLGGIEQTKEHYRDRRGVPWLQTLLQDVRFGLRMLRKSPGFTAVAVLTLALGIGANTAIFSVVNAVMIRSLPYRDAGRLVYIWTPVRSIPQMPVDVMGPTNADFFDIQRQAHSFSILAHFASTSFNLAAQGIPQRIGGARVTAEFFSTLGILPVLGRTINAEDDQPGHEHIAVISHALWQSEFGGDATALGKAISLDGQSYQVIGVMPPAFLYPRSTDIPYDGVLDTQVWVPAALTFQQRAERNTGNGLAIGRLQMGVSVSQAQAEMTTMMARLDQLHSSPNLKGWYAVVRPLEVSAIGNVRLLLWLLLGAVSLVLLIACSNVANLLLARLAARTHELGVRAAVGAARARIARQMLTESTLLAGIGGALGVLVAYGAIRILLRFDPGNIPRLSETSLDRRVLLYSLGVSMLTVILFGVLPAINASQTGPGELLKRGANRGVSRSSSRLGRSLVVVEVGLAIVLLADAGLLARSYLKLQSVDPGFLQSTLTMNLSLDSRYSNTEQRRGFFSRVLDAVSALPGVQIVGAVDYLPLSHSESLAFFMVEGYEFQKTTGVESRSATVHYFEAMGIPLVEGRLFNEADIANRPLVAIINQSFAKMYFAGQDPLGRRVRLSGRDYYPWCTIVGVVGDVRHSNLEDTPSAQIYMPFRQTDPTRAFIAIRTTLPPAQLIPTIRKIVRTIDPALAVSDIRTMDQRVSEAKARRQFQTLLLMIFGVVALFLAAEGVYGLLAYSVRQRTAEIGVRLALGAQRETVLKMVIGDGIKLVLVGVVLGIAGALSSARFLSSLLFDVRPTDPLTFAGVALVLLAVALFACYIPARRAMKVDPMVALRYE